jgi:hydrogenase maturation protease
VVDRLIVGIGNPDRGDDAVGRIVARQLMQRAPADVRIVEHAGEATALLNDFRSARSAWLIDAAQSGSPPGTIHRIDCSTTDAVPPRGSLTSHGFGAAEAIALARILGTLPLHCIVYAITAGQFALGAAPSPAVTLAAHDVVKRILAELATPPLPSAHRPPHPAPAPDRR